MFKRFSVLVLAGFLSLVSAHAEEIMTDGPYFFRYKLGYADSQPAPDEQTKDITAYYIGGLNKPFSEKLPMKPQWANDSWRLAANSNPLPAGISFNAGTLMFEGTPTAVVADVEVDLVGIDSNANQVATAAAHFSVYKFPDNVVDVEIYHHTGFYASDALKLPDGVVIDGDPTLKSAVPPGVKFNARYFDGTPTTAGTYPILAFGYDYLHDVTKPIIAFTGHYIVEDTPTFANLPNDLRKLNYHPDYGCEINSECALWAGDQPPHILHTLGPANKVKYFAEVSPGQKFPGNMNFGSDPTNMYIWGKTYQAYQQAQMRFKAIDSDGVPGYSNWFTVGSLGAAEECIPTNGAPLVPLVGTVGQAFYDTGYAIPRTSDAYKKLFTVVSGTMPDGLTLNPSTGVISGKPANLTAQKGVRIDVSYPTVGNSSTVHCGPYNFAFGPGALSLDYSGLKADYRVGEPLNVPVFATGATVAPYTITMNSDAVLPPGVKFAAASHTLSGTVDADGSFSATFTLANGDGINYYNGIAFVGHKNVKIDSVPTSSDIKRYDTTTDLFTVTYDHSTIIGDPTFTVTPPLPTGLTLDGLLNISGGTRLPENAYGPFQVTVTDSTGMSDKTNGFMINVTKRADLIAGATKNPLNYFVNLADNGQQPFSVTQAPLAVNYFPLKYTLTPSTLPTGLGFDPTTGLISGKPTAKITTDPYTLTVDEVSPDNLSKTSDPFVIDIADPPPISPITLPTLEGNVNGVMISSVSPYPYLDQVKTSLVGGVASVKTVDQIMPAIAGLTPDLTGGLLSGVPTEEFSGNVDMIYHDGAGRTGHFILPVHIYPYPALQTLKSNQAASLKSLKTVQLASSADFKTEMAFLTSAASSGPSFNLPRLSQAVNAGIGVKAANTGFYKGVTYSMGPGSDPLPSGLFLAPDTGMITGRTTDPIDEVRNIVVRGTSKANGLTADQSFSITVTAETPMKLDLEPKSKIWVYVDETTMAVKDQQDFSAVNLTGSYQGKVTYTLGAGTPDWIKINANTGHISFSSPPALGETLITVIATDSDTIQNSANDTATIKVSKYGPVTVLPAPTALTVRESETFKTDPLTVGNVVEPWVWTYPVPAPSSVSMIDTPTGTYRGLINAVGKFTWTNNILDADARTMSSGLAYPNPGVKFNVTTVQPVGLEAATSKTNGKQYDPNTPVTVQFRAATNIMGTASYGITGDVPGTLVYKYYDQDDPVQLATYYYWDKNNNMITVRQLATDTADVTEFKGLPPDHMVFDSYYLTLKGIPSRAGSFTLAMTVYDDYQDKGYLGSGYLNPGDAHRVDYNSKTSPTVTVSVAPADDLQVANNMDTEALSQFTSQPTLTSTITYDAYGRGVNWSPLTGSGKLPSKVYAPYPNTPVAGMLDSDTLRYYGYPDTQGTWDNIGWQAQDIVGRKINTNPVSFTVGPRQALKLVTSASNPRGMQVFVTDADMMVSAVNLPNGKLIGAANWIVTGSANLPPNVTYTVTDAGVHFSGISNKIGKYTGINISATDSLGQKASISLTFVVVSSSDPIVLNVYDITTKPNYPIEMQPPFAQDLLSTSNTYGNVHFYSNDLPSIQGITLNGQTGYIVGSVATAQNILFDLYVTDDTNRVTSKPITVKVIPNLRLIVPTRVTVIQGTAGSSNIATDYSLGTVTYERGSGNWPDGVLVNATTGAIYGTPSGATGDYPNLTVRATDTFGSAATSGPYTDTQESNSFTIHIDPIQAKPVITDIAKNKMIFGTVGTFASFTPTVVDNIKKNPWNYGGTVYSLNHTLPAGLDFNTATGVISGTATEPVIIRDLTITVTSERGDQDTTTPFWFGVAPAGPIVPPTAPAKPYVARATSVFTSPAPLFTNWIGNPVYTKTTGPSLTFSGATGVLTGTITTAMVKGSTTLIPVTVVLTDEFGRTGTYTYNMITIAALSTTAVSTNVIKGTDYPSLFTPKTTGQFGNLTYTVLGLPYGLTFDANTGMIYGKLDDNTDYDSSYPVTVRVTDDFDNKVATANGIVGITKSAYLYFRIYDNQSNNNPLYWGCATIALYDSAGVKLNSRSKALYSSGGIQAANRVSAISKFVDGCQIGKVNGAFWTYFHFDAPQDVQKVVFTYDNGWNAANSGVYNPQFQGSQDGVNWTALWSTNFGNNMVSTSVRPVQQ